MSHITKDTLAKEASALWATLKDKKLSPKDRMAIPSQEMATGEPKARSREMNEVALGYTDEQAKLEAVGDVGRHSEVGAGVSRRGSQRKRSSRPYIHSLDPALIR